MTFVPQTPVEVHAALYGAAYDMVDAIDDAGLSAHGHIAGAPYSAAVEQAIAALNQAPASLTDLHLQTGIAATWLGMVIDNLDDDDRRNMGLAVLSTLENATLLLDVLAPRSRLPNLADKLTAEASRCGGTRAPEVSSAHATAWASLHQDWTDARAEEGRYHNAVWTPAYEAGPIPDEVDSESDRLTDARYAVQQRLFAFPSLRADQLATKILIAFDGNREGEHWLPEILADCRRLADDSMTGDLADLPCRLSSQPLSQEQAA